MSTLFGKIVTERMVRDAVEATLRLWMPTYLAEVGEQSNLVNPAQPDQSPRCVLPAYRSYAHVHDDLDKKPEDQLPACVVVSSGTIGDPERHRDKWKVTWSIGVGSLVSANNERATNDLAGYYAAAARAALLQNGSLGGFADGVWFLGESYDNDIATDSTRTLSFSMVNLAVDVFEALDSRAGISEPLADPCADPGNGPIVLTTDAQL